TPTCAANCCTSEDLPMPGGPQMKTGRASATLRRKSPSCFCVTVTAEFMLVHVPLCERCTQSCAVQYTQRERRAAGEKSDDRYVTTWRRSGMAHHLSGLPSRSLARPCRM